MKIPKKKKVTIGFPKPSKIKAKRIKLMSMKKLKKLADDTFARYIRERDKHCYGQEIPEERLRCKGFLCDCHLIGRGKNAIRYDEKNNNAGCSFHNQIHDHIDRPQPHIYTNWFIKKYGAKAYQELADQTYIIKQWKRWELEEIIKTYTEKYKKLLEEKI